MPDKARHPIVCSVSGPAEDRSSEHAARTGRRALEARPRLRALAASLLAVLAFPAVAEELLDLPLEQLLETDVVSAAQFARELTDAPSAVAVVTAEDIRIFGYRSLAEILDSMRGLTVGFDGNYYFPGGRGYGRPGEYAGRITLLIDGYPVADNIYNQIYLGDDGLLDTAVIERVEYAPGPGAAIYGNNAFLGVINVITRRGRDVDGVRAAVTTGSHGDRETRLTWGKRFGNGAEWLVSASAHRIDPYDPPVTPFLDIEQTEKRNRRLFVKGQIDGWRVEGAIARRTAIEHVTPPPTTSSTSDENAFVLIGHDAEHGVLRSSAKLYYGQYRYGYQSELRDEFGYIQTLSSVGRWWGADGKLSFTTDWGHRIVAGAEFRDDYAQQRNHAMDFPGDPSSSFSSTERGAGRSLSVYFQDEIPLRPNLDLNLGARYERRKNELGARAHFNPRAALLYRPSANTSLKLSHGVAGRFPSWSTEQISGRQDREQVTTTEFVVDHRHPGLRLLATVYRYRMDDTNALNVAFGEHAEIETTGAELEAEWQWRSVVVRGSHAWQRARSTSDGWLANSPRHLSKLQVSAPLAGEALRASLAARYVGKRRTLPGATADGYALADLTLTSRTLLPGVEFTAAVRNLFDRPYGDVNGWIGDGLRQRDGRTFWMQVEYVFQ